MQILKEGAKHTIINTAEIINSLEPAVYKVESGMFGYFLVKEELFERPKKVYSNDRAFIEHVMKTWNSSDDSVGIVLKGKKGLGKSFTARLLALETGLPIILTSESQMRGGGYIDLLNNIKQPHVVYIDEFEKIFEDSKSDSKYMSQQDFLSYLDGTSSGYKRMFIITSNNNINQFLVDRPSRLRYFKSYDYMDSTLLKEICDDRLNNKEYAQDIIENVTSDNLNIDVLIKIIDECNLHDKKYSEFKEFFNYKPTEQTYSIELKVPEFIKPVILSDDSTQHIYNYFQTNPIASRSFGEWEVRRKPGLNIKSNKDSLEVEVEYASDNIVDEEDRYIWKNGLITFKKSSVKQYHYNAF